MDDCAKKFSHTYEWEVKNMPLPWLVDEDFDKSSHNTFST